MRTLVMVAATTALLTTASTATASGFLAARFGGEHGHPTTDNPTALYYNPAGLALAQGTRLYLDGTFARRTASYERPPGAIDNLGTNTPASAVSANAGLAELDNFIASPFLALTSDLGVENLGVGLGLYVPVGGSAVWDTNDEYEGNTSYPGAVDGVQRWFTMDGTVRSLYVTAGGAYRLEEPRLSFGLGVSFVSSQLSTIRARNADGGDDLVVPDGQGGTTLQEGRSFLDASGTNLALSAGVIWEAIDDLFIGASYQSQPGFGEMTLTGTLKTTLGTTPPDETEVEVLQSLPDVFRLGLRLRPSSNLETRLFGEYARWSVFERQCVLNASVADRKCALRENGSLDPDAGGAGVVQNLPRNWEDAFGVRAGASYFFTAPVEAYLGLGYDSNAVPDETLDPALMDMPKYTVALGARFTLLDDALAIAGTFTQVFYQERERSTDARPAGGARVGFAPPSRQPDAAGIYNQSVSVLNVATEYTF